MKICMIAYTHYPTDSRVRREAEALVDRGDKVVVICLGEKHTAEQETLNGVTMEKIRHGRYRGGNALQYIIAYLKFFFAASFRVTRLYLKNRYPVIQVHTMPDFMVFTTMIPRLLGAKIILDVHDLMPELYQSKFGYSAKHPIIRALVWSENASIWFAHKAIAVHTPHLEALVSHGNRKDKFIELLNLPDEKLYTKEDTSIAPETDKTFRLVYHGTISRRHGLDVAIRAVAAVEDAIPNIRFEITGDGDDVDRIISLTADLTLTNIVKINKGMVPMEELVPRLRQAHIGIVPIILDSFTQYMLPVKLLEYTALGVPVICTRTKTIETYFDESMVAFFSSGNPDELASHILVLYQDSKKRENQAQQAERFLHTYNWQSQKNKYIQLIDSLAQ